VVPVVALTLALLHCWVLARDPGRPSAGERCDPALLVDGSLRCGARAPRGWGELCDGEPGHPPPTSGDAIDSARACAGDRAGVARMDADSLARLQIAVDINRADAAELASLPGIGPVIAARVIAGRPYRGVDELERVRGIGPRTVEKLRARAMVTD
jgi:predicted flap endonuclease-1-like 5' DNA nuclease